MRTTRPEVWPTTIPFVVSIVPTDGVEVYGFVIRRLIGHTEESLNWPEESISHVGLIATSIEHGTESIMFMEEMGVSSRSITLMLLWGETSDCVGFDDTISPECGMGFVSLVRTGVLLPALRMPSLESGWWGNRLNQQFAAVTVANALRDGRIRPDGSENVSHIYTADLLN